MLKSKYKNIKYEHNGLKFDSKKEFNRYLYLLKLKESGEIQNLEMQKKFVLYEKQTLDNGAVINKQSYIADFCYNKGFEYIVEDVKGYKKKNGRNNPAYTLFLKKKKNMMNVYGIEIKEI